MSAQSLENLLQSVGNPVTIARNSQIGPYVYPGYASEFTNWRDEQHAWRETCCLFDQSYHMTDMYIQGPGALELLKAVGVNSFENFALGKAKQLVVCNSDGYVIGDAILFFLEDELLNLVGRPSAHNWVQYHCETGGYDATCERDERAAVNPNNRKVYRYQVQGPKSSRPGTPDMPWCRARTWWPAIVIQSMLKNLVSGSGPPLTFSSTLRAFGPCTW